MSSSSTVTSTNQVDPTSAISSLPDELLLEIFAVGTLYTSSTNFPFLVAAVCHYWCSLVINDASLWTSLIFKPVMELPSLSSDGSSDAQEIFPREALILKRSANRDIDCSIFLYWHQPDSFSLLSSLLAEHAHHIWSFKAEAQNWREITCLCKDLAFKEMPQLWKWHLMSLSGNHLVYEDKYNETDAVEYTFNSDSNSVPMQELKHSSTLQYPVLTDVTISGVPNHLSMQTLHGILSNSKDTLETLTLKWAIWASNCLLMDHVTLLHIKSLDIGYMQAQEACQMLRIFDFPALHNLKLDSLYDDVEGSQIFIDMMMYLPLEQLEELGLICVKLPLGDFPDHDLVKSGTITEELLPLLLQFVCQLIHVSTLMLSPCSDTLLKYMNYPKGGSINMAGLKKVLLSGVIKNPDDGIWQFQCKRVKLKVDGEDIGPIIEGMNPYINFCMGILPNKWWDAGLENSLTLNSSWDVSDII
ncbi:hypothetical protein EDD18DRAFT_1404253 [Armillaria luteobubalina]|uniref:F-box domain-containing protein n=1 Tax=Armillaria luteobubalina TaxID=153913 RepID=A0AA39TL79_9AGAR|nr:hypothetical protein EDD18DRAFT_1404253 [Armillaria luteobubalina]